MPQAQAQTVIGGTTPDASAMLDVQGTTKGVLLPRLTTAERDALVAPAKSLLIFNTTLNCTQINTGTSGTPDWQCLLTNAAGEWIDDDGTILARQAAANGDTVVVTDDGRLFMGRKSGAGSFLDGLAKIVSYDNNDDGLASVMSHFYNDPSGTTTSGGAGVYLVSQEVGSAITADRGIIFRGANSHSSRGGDLYVRNQYLGSNVGEFIIGGNGNFYLKSGGILNSTKSNSDFTILGTSGNVGIGTTTPLERLHVDANNDSLQFENLAGTGTLLGIDGAGKVFKTAAAAGEWIDDDGTILARQAAAAGDTVVITDDGRLGIGTATPTQGIHTKTGNVLFQAPNSTSGVFTLIQAGQSTSGNTSPGISLFPLDYSASGVLRNRTLMSRTWENHTSEPDLFQIRHEVNGSVVGRITINDVGNVGIGVTGMPTERLDVVGNIRASGNLQSGTTTYPDYVFEAYEAGTSDLNKTYSFKSLEEVEEFINLNKHLPGVTGIHEVEKTDDGYSVNLTELSVQTLEKVEELYLHTIEQNKQIKEQKAVISQQAKELAEMKERLERIEALLLKK
ncbi:MAG: hypothetical protein Sapg2KO_49550 [Saprospiraceae bacterium]